MAANKFFIKVGAVCCALQAAKQQLEEKEAQIAELKALCAQQQVKLVHVSYGVYCCCSSSSSSYHHHHHHHHHHCYYYFGFCLTSLYFQRSLQVRPVPREPSVIAGAKLFTGLMSLLSPNKQFFLNGKNSQHTTLLMNCCHISNFWCCSVMCACAK